LSAFLNVIPLKTPFSSYDDSIKLSATVFLTLFAATAAFAAINGASGYSSLT